MHKYFRYLIYMMLIVLSFYFTNQTAVLVRNQDPLMQEIRDYSAKNSSEPVNAIIHDEFIIPGLYGTEIDELQSLINMKKHNTFNSIFLISKQVKPSISLKDHKDKIIKQGNPGKRAVSFILENDESSLPTYFITKNIPASLLINNQTFNGNPYFEQINNDDKNYNIVEKELNNYQINTNICLVSSSISNHCLRNKKYLVSPSLTLTESNLLSVKENATSGSIILIKDTANQSDVDVLVNYLKGKGLAIINLSSLIKED